MDITAYRILIWENNKPSYTLYCRAICLRYEKESKETILEEERFLRQADLAPTNIEIVKGG